MLVSDALMEQTHKRRLITLSNYPLNFTHPVDTLEGISLLTAQVSLRKHKTSTWGEGGKGGGNGGRRKGTMWKWGKEKGIKVDMVQGKGEGGRNG